MPTCPESGKRRTSAAPGKVPLSNSLLPAAAWESPAYHHHHQTQDSHPQTDTPPHTPSPARTHPLRVLQPEAEAAQQHDQDQRCLGDGKLVADALARAAACGGREGGGGGQGGCLPGAQRHTHMDDHHQRQHGSCRGLPNATPRVVPIWTPASDCCGRSWLAGPRAHQRAGRQSRRRLRWGRGRSPPRRGCTQPTCRQTRRSQTALQGRRQAGRASGAASVAAPGASSSSAAEGTISMRRQLLFGPQRRRQAARRRRRGREPTPQLACEALWPEGVRVLPQVGRPARAGKGSDSTGHEQPRAPAAGGEKPGAERCWALLQELLPHPTLQNAAPRHIRTTPLRPPVQVPQRDEQVCALADGVAIGVAAQPGRQHILAQRPAGGWGGEAGVCCGSGLAGGSLRETSGCDEVRLRGRGVPWQRPSCVFTLPTPTPTHPPTRLPASLPSQHKSRTPAPSLQRPLACG